VHQVHAGNLAAFVRGDDAGPYLYRMIRRRLVADIQALTCELPTGILEVPRPFLAHRVEINGVASRLLLLDAAARFLDQAGVEAAAETPVRGDQDDGGPAWPTLADRLWGGEERELVGELGCEQITQGVAQCLGVGPGSDHAILGSFELGRGHELHRPRDLARVPDRADPALEL